MKPLRLAVPLAFALALGAPVAAQQPGRPGGAGPQEGRPGPRDEHAFLIAQTIRAIDEKVSLLLEQGKSDLAIEELKRAYTLDVPRQHPVYEGKTHLIGRLANVYAQTGKKKEAVETIQKLLADVPQGTVAEATAWLEAGSVYKQAGMADEALKAFDRAISLSESLAKQAPRGPAGRPPMPGGNPGRPEGPPPPR